MAEGKTRDDFLSFLDWLGKKNLLPQNTADARKAVANKMLAALEPAELSDVTLLDVDDVVLRFTNKFGQQYTSGSLQTYRSRFETSLADFKVYCSDPVGYRPNGRLRIRRKPHANGEVSKSATIAKTRSVKVLQPQTPNLATNDAYSVSAGNSLPIQIRANLTVTVGPIPFDLSEQEAKKIANIILAHAAIA